MNNSIATALFTAFFLLACSSEPVVTNFQFSTGKPDLLGRVDSSDLLVVVTVDDDGREFPGELRTDGRWNVSMNVELDMRHTFVASWYATGNSQRVLLVEQTGEFTASSTNATVRPETTDVSSGSERFDSDCDGVSNLDEVIASSNPLTSPGCNPSGSEDSLFEPIDNPGTAINKAVKLPAGFVSLEGGCFLMGPPHSDVSHVGDDHQKTVCVDPFTIGRYEVTNKEFSKYSGTFGDPARPVTAINFLEALRYTRWLSQTTGRTYRLPTEAEWEYAARGETQFPFWSGEYPKDHEMQLDSINVLHFGIARISGLDSDEKRQPEGQPKEVGTLQPNSFGLYDMQGNVTEFTCSQFSETYATNDEQMCNYDATRQRVVRGGNYLYNVGDSGIYYRPETVSATQRNDHIGFRLVLEGT